MPFPTRTTTMQRLITALAASLALSCPFAPAKAQTAPTNCVADFGPAVCAGWIVGASVCYDRRHPYENSTDAAVRVLISHGIDRSYLHTQTALLATADYIRTQCP